jgi:uncharacterized protein
MKHIVLYGIFLLSVSLPGWGQKLEELIPSKPSGWVSDLENIFTREQAAYLEGIIGKYEERTSNEIAVVTLHLDSTTIHSAQEFEALSLLLFKKWGVGKKEKNNGIVILFSVHLRRIRIEVGYGLEGLLTDKMAKDITDTSITPEFKQGNYFTGIRQALERIFKEIE